MNSSTRWHFNPLNPERLLDQQQDPQPQILSRSSSSNELRHPYQRSTSPVARPPRDRICKNVPYPIVHQLRIDELFDFRNEEKPSIDLLIHHFKNEGRLAESAWRHLFAQAKSLFRQEPNIICLPPGCTIVGDIHGQYYDLLTILELGGRISEQPYVFLGDYVDRGSFSCECLFLLLALKVAYPRSVILLRGNHESRQMTKSFTYKKECQVKYSKDLWHESMILFDSLPLCVLIDDRFLCMHGGISPYIESLDDIAKLDRFREIPYEGPFCDLLWSDPNQKFAAPQTPPWTFNTARNCSFLFNYQVCEQFLIKNRLLAIIRAHEVVPNGILLYENGSLSQFPVLISLFSAPNYCDVYNNVAALMIYDQQRNIRPVYFVQRPHPFVLPNHENGFEFGNRLMKTLVQEIILALIRNSVKSVDLSQPYGMEDNLTKRLKAKEKMLAEHTHKCQDINKMSIQLGNLTPPEPFQEKALKNQDILQEVTVSLSKSLGNDSSSTFESASRIDALYEQRLD